MAQVRITLIEDPGKPISMQYGYDVIVPMDFGTTPSPEAMTSFRSNVSPLPAQPRRWHLDWNNPDMRSVLVPVEVATHYFGNWNSSNERAYIDQHGVFASFNSERERVALVWGNFGHHLGAGPYATVRIRLPKIPRVIITRVNENGSNVGDWKFDPWAFFKWEDMLDPRAEELRLEDDALINPKATRAALLENLSESDIEFLAKAIAKKKVQTS